MLMVVILTACLAGSTQAQGIDPKADVWQAPSLPEWPAGLSGRHRTPSQAKCLFGQLELGEGLWLSAGYTDAIWDRLSACGGMPGLVQRQLDRIRDKVLPDFVAAAVDEAVAAAKEDWIKGHPSGSFRDWMVELMIVGAAVVGILVGVGASAVMR